MNRIAIHPITMFSWYDIAKLGVDVVEAVVVDVEVVVVVSLEGQRISSPVTILVSVLHPTWNAPGHLVSSYFKVH